MRKRVNILVSGYVQGVFYRATVLNGAKELNLTGFVKNEEDGKVMIIAEGKEDDLEKFIERVKRGSLLANISKTEVKWDKAQGEFKDFEIRY